jgi:hypothetical protein
MISSDRQAGTELWPRHARLAAVNHPRWNWVRRRTARRLLVVALAGSLIATVVFGLTGFAWDVPGTSAVSFLRLAASLLFTVSFLTFQALMWLLIGPATRGVFWLWAGDLDERQEAAKRRMFRICYTVVGMLAGPAVIVIAFLGAWVLPDSGAGADDWWQAIPRLLFGLAFPSTFAILLLPAAVGAWTGPDDRPDS